MRRWFRSVTLRLVLGVLALCTAASAHAGTLVIATVDNDDTSRLRSMSRAFEDENPDIRLRWVLLDAKVLRRAVSAEIQTQAAQFDVMMIGNYKVPIWAERGWLKPIGPETVDDAQDLLPSVRDSLTHRRELYAAPFAGEGSLLLYRKDLMQKAGLTMPDRPTWTEVAAFAARLHDPANSVHGICLRGSPGWIENMTLVTTMVNAFGGQWFDMRWRPQLDSLPWKKAVDMYVGLLTRFGPPDAAKLGHEENLALFAAGRCALWVGTTAAAKVLTNPESSTVANDLGFAAAPSEVTARGAHRLWTWSLVIPRGIDPAREAAARKFIRWATSRDYAARLAAEQGWGVVPTGTRRSTYAQPEFQRMAPWGRFELEAILSSDPNDATLLPSPYLGIQFAAIPEFMLIGDEVGKLIAQALSGKLTVEEALARGQDAAQRSLARGGYPK